MPWTRSSFSYAWVKRDSISLGMGLSRHLQVLVASFPECFPPDWIADLKCDCFYGGLPKWLKAMVAYLKASTNKKPYSISRQQGKLRRKRQWNHLIARLLTLQVSPKWWVSSPLQKLKGTQPARTPAVWVAHFGRRQFQQGRGCHQWRPWWNWGFDWGIHSVPCPGSGGGSARGEMLLPLQQPRAFHLWLPTGEGIQNWYTFKTKRRGWCQRRESGLLQERWPHQRCPRKGCPRHRMSHANSLLESKSLQLMVWDKKM